MIHFVALLCVLGIAAGQILFKLSAIALRKNATFFHIEPLILLGSAFALYGITTIAWVWLLQKIDLGKVYPMMALAFVIVPIGSYYMFDERFPPQYFLGISLIVLGIIVAVRS